MGKFLVRSSAFWQNSTLESTHIEQQIRIILTVYADETILPLYRSRGSGQSIFYVPEYSTTSEENEEFKLRYKISTFQFNPQFSIRSFVYLQINVMFHETHSRVTRPTFFIIITHDIFIIRIWMLCQISLN